MTVRLGLIDSGLDPRLSDDAEACCRVALAEGDGGAGIVAPLFDRLGHGSAMARLILARVPTVRLLSVQVFGTRAAASAAAVAAGLDWLVDQGARVVNMSIGLTEDRAVLREACRRATGAGVLAVASVPAIGPPVFPAAYPGMIRVTGDARCSADEIAALGGGRADFGACPWPDGGPPGRGRPPPVAGASVATARVSAALAGLLAAHDGDAALALLASSAAHHGPQRVPS